MYTYAATALFSYVAAVPFTYVAAANFTCMAATFTYVDSRGSRPPIKPASPFAAFSWASLPG